MGRDPLRSLRVDPAAGVDLEAQIQGQIAWLIASEKLAEGDRLPPIRRLAQRLGVHMHTVRAAYALLEAEGLVDARPGAGTRVRHYDAPRQSLHTPDVPSFTIGVILPEYSPFYLPYLRGIEHAARDMPALFLFSNAHNDSRLATRHLDQLVAKGVDGILLTALPVDLAERMRPQRGRPSRLPPVVAVDIPRAAGPAVVLDSEGAGDQATDHLIRVHHYRRIGLVTAPLTLVNVRQVFDGYRRALRRNRLPLHQELMAETSDFSPEEGRRAAHALLESSPDLAAIFAVSDMLAAGVLQAARERGRRVPQHLAVVGYNDIEVAALVDPPLTTVTAPAFAMGQAAMEMMSVLTAGKQPRPLRQVLATSLVIRRSCGCKVG